MLGNHDFGVAAEKKSEVMEQIGMKSHCYSQRLDTFRFIMLDGTEISTYRYPQDATEHQDAERRLANLKETKAPNAQPWNGGMGEEQVAWLDAPLSEFETADERAILMCHYPVFPVNAHNLWNDKQVLAVIDKHP